MKYILRVVCLLFSAIIFPITASAAPATPFRIGVAPHSSARVIVGMYQPLRAHLEKVLSLPVEIITAPDFTEFARRAANQQYDIAITTGHQARLLQTDAGYLPLLTYKSDFRAIALVAKESAYQAPTDLAGTTVFGLSPSSLVTIWGQHWLQRNGVQNAKVRYVSAADSVVQLVLKGEGSAAFTSLANYNGLSTEVRSQLRILDESLPMAGRVYLLNGRLSTQKAKIDASLWEFSESPEAKQYFAQYNLNGYRQLGPRELNEMEPYANEVRQVLKQTSR